MAKAKDEKKFLKALGVNSPKSAGAALQKLQKKCRSHLKSITKSESAISKAVKSAD